MDKEIANGLIQLAGVLVGAIAGTVVTWSLNDRPYQRFLRRLSREAAKWPNGGTQVTVNVLKEGNLIARAVTEGHLKNEGSSWFFSPWEVPPEELSVGSHQG